jgi:formate/nitrite transporter FocA (FNT family)
VTEQRPSVPEPEVEEAFDRLVDEGEVRLARPILSLISTGLLGGIDIGAGVLAYLLVDAQTGSVLLAGVAFSVGFVALLLARSELFTENFLVPVLTVVARKASWFALARLWVLTLATNLIGGWVITWLIVTARPDLKPTAIEVGTHYANLGISAQSFALAVLAGAVITLMTRMQHATDNLGVQLVPSILFGALLSAASSWSQRSDCYASPTASPNPATPTARPCARNFGRRGTRRYGNPDPPLV